MADSNAGPGKNANEPAASWRASEQRHANFSLKKERERVEHIKGAQETRTTNGKGWHDLGQKNCKMVYFIITQSIKLLFTSLY